MAKRSRAGWGILHRSRSYPLRSVVEDLRARGVRPHHVRCIHEILLGLVGLAGEEHFAVAGHDPAVELAVDGTMDLELDHSCWFSSSCMPGGAHQRRVIRGRRAEFSQSEFIIVIILMSKLCTYWIRRPIRRYGATDRHATRVPQRREALVEGPAPAGSSCWLSSRRRRSGRWCSGFGDHGVRSASSSSGSPTRARWCP
jgi:hypothetical protein